MRGGLAGLGRRAEADGRPAGDHGRPVALLRLLDRRGDLVGVLTVDAARVPAGGLEARDLVAGLRQRQRPVDRDAVVVEEDDQLVQPEVAGDRDRLVAEPLHQVAVGGNDVGVVVDDVVAELGGHQPLGERHADGVAEPLAERTGGGLDAEGDEVLRMPRRLRAELAEVADLVDRHPLDAEEIEDRIEQHRAVAGGEHEAVAVGPARVGRVELQVAGEQHGGDVGHAHRHARMAGFGALNGIHGERADRVRHTLVLDEVGHEALA